MYDISNIKEGDKFYYSYVNYKGLPDKVLIYLSYVTSYLPKYNLEDSYMFRFFNREDEDDFTKGVYFESKSTVIRAISNKKLIPYTEGPAMYYI